MSVDASTIEIAEHVDRVRDVRMAYRECGHPPSSREVAEHAPLTRGYYEHYPGTWDELLAAAGVPTPDEVIVECLRELLDERPPWQDFIRIRAPDVAEATGLTAARVGVAIQRIVDEGSDVDAPADIEFERAEPARAWEVREA